VPAPTQTQAQSLAQLPAHDQAQVLAVAAPPGQPDWAQQLQDLGFVAGERVSVLARARPGGDPLVVRVGLSTYALRLAEAACVQIEPLRCPESATHA
jgi:ferrous iron transport protein A